MIKRDPIGIKVVPVKKYKPPKYPTHVESKRNPDMLRKLPPRWQKNAAVVVATGFLSAMTLTSCQPNEIESAVPLSSNQPNEITTTIPLSSNFLNVAPIFMHGDGTGAIGCLMVAPPVFLSEAEAFAIIKNVSEDVGLKFDAEPPQYIAAKNEVIDNDDTENWWARDYHLILGDGNVGLNLYDKEKDIAISYVAMKKADIRYYSEDPSVQIQSSVTEFRSRELAELVAADFAQQKGDIAVGVFYEPSVPWEEKKVIIDEYRDNMDRIKYEKQMKEMIREDLRAQVCDFIEWLQGQGII